MNKAFIVCFLAFCSFAFAKAEEEADLFFQTAVKGVVMDNPAAPDVAKKLHFHYNVFEDNVTSYDLDKDGAFDIKLDIEGPEVVFLDFGSRIHELYLQPGFDLFITVSYEGGKEKIDFKGIGAQENKCLTAFYDKFYGENSKAASRRKSMYEMNASAFRKANDSQKRKEAAFIDEKIKQQSFTDDFIAYWRAETEYGWANSLLEYPVLLKHIKGKEEIRSGDAYYDFLDKLNVNNSKAILNRRYMAFVENYLYYLYAQKNPDSPSEDYFKIYEIAKETFRGGALDYALTFALLKGMETERAALLEQKYADYGRLVRNPVYANIVRNRFERSEAKVADIFEKESAEHTGELLDLPPDKKQAFFVDPKNPNGTDKSFREILDHFLGKVVYVEFWESNSIPSKVQMTHKDKLQKTFASEDVVFLQISYDADLNIWRQAVDKYELGGAHFFPTKNQRKVFTQSLNIEYTPHYILVDKTGKVVDMDAKAPNQSGVAAEIGELLEY